MLSSSHIQGLLEDICMTTETFLLMFSIRYASRMGIMLLFVITRQFQPSTQK